MKSMPAKIKSKIRQVQRAYEKAKTLEEELTEMFEEYGIDPEKLCGNGNIEDLQTEALSFVVYDEGDVEDNIKSIEEVFLHYINQNQ